MGAIGLLVQFNPPPTGTLAPTPLVFLDPSFNAENEISFNRGNQKRQDCRDSAGSTAIGTPDILMPN